MARLPWIYVLEGSSAVTFRASSIAATVISLVLLSLGQTAFAASYEMQQAVELYNSHRYVECAAVLEAIGRAELAGAVQFDQAAHYYLANCYSMSSRKDDAKDQYALVYALNPHSSIAAYALQAYDQIPLSATKTQSPSVQNYQSSDAANVQAFHTGNGMGYTGSRIYRASPEAPLVVVSVLAGGPSAEAGLHVGDEILSIDGTPARGMRIEVAQSMVVGRIGTVVTLKIKRVHQQLTVSVRRATLKHA